MVYNTISCPDCLIAKFKQRKYNKKKRRLSLGG